MTKLMITALLCCSSLSLADDSLTAAKKKASKTEVVTPTSDAQKADETVFGGLSTSARLGTAGTGAPKSKPKLQGLRGTAPAATK